MLTGTGRLLSNTIDISAVDMHFTDKQIQSFRIYRNVKVNSAPHNQDELYQLTKLDIDLQNPQNTKITVGKTTLTMTDTNNKNQSDFAERIETAEKDIEKHREQITEVNNTVIQQYSKIVSDCNGFTAEALKDYVETSTFKEFRETTETELSLVPGKIEASFKESERLINEVDGDLQLTQTDLERHFEFGLQGMKIKANDENENIMNIRVDHNLIQFQKGSEQFGNWDGVNFKTTNVVVTLDDKNPTGNEKAQFGNFAFVPRSDGSLSLLKVGG